MFAFFFAAFDPSFDVPDDAFIMFTLDGFFYGAPDYRTVFMSTLLTRGLAELYTHVPDVPWYGLFLYGLHFAAVVVWLQLFLRRPRALLEVVLFAFGLLALTFPMMLEVTFSSAALAAGAMGIFLHFERSGAAGSRLGAPVLGAVLLGLAYLTRVEVVPALLLPAVPMLLFRARSVPLGRHAIAFVVFLSLVLAGVWSDSRAYASPEWQSFQRRLALSVALIDSPKLTRTPELLELAARAGWSQNDLSLFARFVYADPEVYDLASISVVAEGTGGLGSARDPLRATRERIVGDHSVELLILLLHLAILVPRMSRRDRWTALALTAAFVGGAVCLATFLKFPSRIALPTTWMVVSWVVVAPHEWRPLLGWIPHPGFRRGLVSTLGTLLIAVPLIELVQESREHVEDRERFLASLRQQRALAPGSTIVALGELPFATLSPMTMRQDLPQFDYVGVGWRQNSPSWDRLLARVGVENVYLAPLERRDVFLAIREDLYPLYQQFVWEHHQRRPDLDLLLPLGDRMVVYGKAP
jgi:hypothetical protein